LGLFFTNSELLRAAAIVRKKLAEPCMAETFHSDAKSVSPRDAQKGGQGALSKEHPEIPLKQEAATPPVAQPHPVSPSEGLTKSQIALLCRIGEGDLSKLNNFDKDDLTRLSSEGYLVPISSNSQFKLTAKGMNFLGRRGAGLNEA
jgi:hypothetical protein